jgi:hypothetical protein
MAELTSNAVLLASLTRHQIIDEKYHHLVFPGLQPPRDTTPSYQTQLIIKYKKESIPVFAQVSERGIYIGGTFAERLTSIGFEKFDIPLPKMKLNFEYSDPLLTKTIAGSGVINACDWRPPQGDLKTSQVAIKFDNVET